MQEDEPAGKVVLDRDHIFFAKQVINNACATQAILSLLLNLNHEDIKLGETLTNFKEFCQCFDPYNKGLTLSNASQIRTVHNSFARQTLFELDMKNQNKDEDVYHFVGYMPIAGRLYELDGLREGPIDLGEIKPEQNWIDVVRPIIEKRMQRYSDGEIHFNLMALISDRQRIYEQQIEKLLNPAANAMDTEEDRQTEINSLRSYIQYEIEKKKRYKAITLSIYIFNMIVFIRTFSLSLSLLAGGKRATQAQLLALHCGVAENAGRNGSAVAHLWEGQATGAGPRTEDEQKGIQLESIYKTNKNKRFSIDLLQLKIAEISREYEYENINSYC